MRASQKIAAFKDQHAPAKKYRRSKTKIKSSTIAVYVSAFVLFIAIISVGYRQPQASSDVANAADVSSVNPVDQTSVDNVVAATVAAGVAQAANLPIATSVANLAVSAQSQSVLVESDSINTNKPQIIGSGATVRSVVDYTVQAGDTVATLAARFNVSSDTIKWANNLMSDSLAPGKVLQILPVNGVLYTVKSDDTTDSIATKYAVDKTRLVLYNDLDVSGLTVGSKIILPNATMPNNERPGYVAPITYTYYAGLGTGFGGQTWYISTGTPNGPYAHGNCTLYVYNRRAQLGLPVGSNWGNANSWAYYARQDGLVVNNSPTVGSIMQNGGYLGHVSIVESIMPNGDLSISEMNAYVSGGGYNIVSGRIVPSGNIGQYLYIH
jgi:surface antigen/LysM repeat protein